MRAHGDRGALWPLLGLALVFGVAEAALFFLRRWAMNKSCLRIERDLRDALYQRLQRLPYRRKALQGSSKKTRRQPR